MIGLIAAGVGLGLQASGAFFQYQGAKKSSEAQQQITMYEQQAEAQRRQLMELEAKRKEIELVRRGMQARALGLVRGTNQGVDSGSSGLAGGLAQVQSDTGYNILGISQNLEIGRNLFDINAQISTQKQKISEASSTSALGSGLSSLGASLTGLSGPLGNLTASAPNNYAAGKMTSYGGPTGQIY